MPKRTPLFSIVMPTRNRGRLLQHALRSAVEQEFDDFEIVVVANACEDNTEEVVSSFQDERIRYYKTDTLLSMPDNWEFAWTKVEGQYVTYLPDDDALVPSALKTCARELKRGTPEVISWEDATYYYPDWHDDELKNLLILFNHGELPVEDVPAESFRDMCANFEFAWGSPIPKMNNCFANRELMASWHEQLGRLFFPVAPDYSFGWIATHLSDSVRVIHRPLTVRGITERTIGASANLGSAGSEFLGEFREKDLFAEVPVELPPTSMKILAATFQRINRVFEERGIPHASIDWGKFLLAASKQLREQETELLIPDRSRYVPDLVAFAETISPELRDTVEQILTAPSQHDTELEGIRATRRRTADMAVEYLPNLTGAVADHLGDEECARCVLGVQQGALAGADWRALYVFGEELGVADPYGMAQQVDRHYDLLLRCSDRRQRATQPTEARLLKRLLPSLERKTLLDLDPGEGRLIRGLLESGADAAYAVASTQASAAELRTTLEGVTAARVVETEDGATLPVGALVSEHGVPPHTGILNLGSRDRSVLDELGDLSADLVLLGLQEDEQASEAASYRLAQAAAVLRERGYQSFVVVRRLDRLETVQVNVAEIGEGEEGSALFVHDRVLPTLAPTIFQVAATAQTRLVEDARALTTQLQESRAQTERVQQALDRETSRARLLDVEVQRVSRLVEDVQRTAATDSHTLTMARLEMLEEQELAIEAYLDQSHVEGTWEWVQPRLGDLAQYDPMPFQIPEHYLRELTVTSPPKISIVTPSLNSEAYLTYTLDSVLEQGYPNLEYIVQDGGSSDSTMMLLAYYRERLAAVNSLRDNGMAQAINRGFTHATGEIMAYLNSDDTLLPGTLNFVAAYFETHPDVDVVYSHRVIINADGAEVGRWVLPQHDDDILRWADYIPQETMFWRRSIWEKAGGVMDESFRFALDWDLLVRFRDAGARFVRLPRFLGAFRVHTTQKTSVELNDVGVAEMDRIRERQAGRAVTHLEAWQYARPYLHRHKVYNKLHNLGVLRY